MEILLLLSMLLLVIAPVQQSDIILEVGAKLKRKHIPKDSLNLYMTHPAQLRPYIKRNIDSVDYVIVFDRKSRKITYITTDDEDFESLEGLKIGSYVEASIEDVVAYPGWEIRAPMLRTNGILLWALSVR